MVVHRIDNKRINVKIEKLYMSNQNSFSHKIILMIVSLVVHKKDI